MSSFLTGGGRVSVTLTATQKLAVASQGLVNVYRTSGFVNYPDSTNLIGTIVNGQTVFGTFTGGATLVIDAGGGLSAQYEVGTDPNVKQWRMDNGIQPDPTAKTTVVTLTAAELLPASSPARTRLAQRRLTPCQPEPFWMLRRRSTPTNTLNGC